MQPLVVSIRKGSHSYCYKYRCSKNARYNKNLGSKSISKTKNGESQSANKQVKVEPAANEYQQTVINYQNQNGFEGEYIKKP